MIFHRDKTAHNKIATYAHKHMTLYKYTPDYQYACKAQYRQCDLVAYDLYIATCIIYNLLQNCTVVRYIVYDVLYRVEPLFVSYDTNRMRPNCNVYSSLKYVYVCVLTMTTGLVSYNAYKFKEHDTSYGNDSMCVLI